MTEPKPANDGDATAPTPPGIPGCRPGASGRFWRDFERALSLAQLTLVLPVVVLVLSGIGAFIYGIVVAVHSVADIADHPFVAHNLRCS